MKTNRGGRDWLTLQSILQRQMSSILLHDSQMCINNVFFCSLNLTHWLQIRLLNYINPKECTLSKETRLTGYWPTSYDTLLLFRKFPKFKIPNISIDPQMMNLVIIAALYIHLKLSQTHLWPGLVLCHVWSSSFTQIKLLKRRRIYLSRNFPTLLNQCKV